jgi:hypothetical protein
VAGRFSSELAKLIRQNRPPKPKPITPKPIAPVAKTAAPPALPETAPPKLDYWNNPDQIMLWTVREGTPGLVAIRRSALAQYEAEREEAKAARVSHPDYGIECSMSSAAL